MQLRSFLLMLVGSTVVSCVLPDAALDGLPCPCSEGYVCDAAANACVPAGAGAQGPGGADPTTGGAGGSGASGIGGSGTGATGSGASGPGGAGGAGPGGSGGVGPGGSGGAGGTGASGGGPVCGNGNLEAGESCEPPVAFVCDDNCQPILSGNEDCGDGIDNDSDAEVDCEDGECDCTCAPEFELPTQNGSNEDGHAIHQGFCVGWDGNPEVLYTFTAGFPGALDIEIYSVGDQGVYVRTDCDDQGSEIGCVDETGGDDTERLIVPAGAGQTLTIFVDTYYPAAAGTFVMTSTLESLDEVEPNNVFGEADALALSAAGATGMIQPVGDEDYFTFTLAAQTLVLLEVVPAGPVTCTFDSEVTLLDDAGGTIDYDDNGAGDGCSSLTALLDAGTYFVLVGSPQSTPKLASFVYRVILTD